jgi:hypothetical protein
MTIGHPMKGKAAQGTNGRFGDQTNPAIGEESKQVSCASRAEMDVAVPLAGSAPLASTVTQPARRAKRMHGLKPPRRSYLAARGVGTLSPAMPTSVEKSPQLVFPTLK